LKYPEPITSCICRNVGKQWVAVKWPYGMAPGTKSRSHDLSLLVIVTMSAYFCLERDLMIGGSIRVLPPRGSFSLAPRVFDAPVARLMRNGWVGILFSFFLYKLVHCNYDPHGINAILRATSSSNLSIFPSPLSICLRLDRILIISAQCCGETVKVKTRSIQITYRVKQKRFMCISCR
jgi:hypothetical protein